MYTVAADLVIIDTICMYSFMCLGNGRSRRQCIAGFNIRLHICISCTQRCTVYETALSIVTTLVQLLDLDVRLTVH